jgi:hypothetical protein
VLIVLVKVVLLLWLIGVLGYVVSGLARRLTGQRALPGSAGRWQVAHFAKSGHTHVVVRKVSPDGVTLVDEHLIAAVPEQDPNYDAQFLEAMAQARERAALYQSEEP